MAEASSHVRLNHVRQDKGFHCLVSDGECYSFKSCHSPMLTVLLERKRSRVWLQISGVQINGCFDAQTIEVGLQPPVGAFAADLVKV
jgi:hypothetical protein